MEYREIGINLVARALDCASVCLVEQDPSGRLSVTSWNRLAGAATCCHPLDKASATVFASLPLLRPAIDSDGTIVLKVRASERELTGWRLVGTVAYSLIDLEGAGRMVSVLADPAMFKQPGRRAPDTLGVLTRREAEILALVAQGLTARAVARRCGISERTVQKHLQHAYRRLGCQDRLSAVLLAQDCGLLGAGAV